jgi:energy-converting hydrogenase A subunit M
MSHDFRDDYLGMIRAVELKKQNVDFDSKFIIDIPETLFNEAKKLNADMTYAKNRDLVKIVKSKLQIDSRIIHDIFKECTKSCGLSCFHPMVHPMHCRFP